MIIKLKNILFIFFAGINMFGQEPDINILFLSSDYASNTNTFGISESTVKQPNLISTANFVFRHNFDLGFSNILTLNSDTSLSKPTFENDLFCGYTFYLNDKWSFYPNYTHMFHSKGAQTLISSFTDIIQSDVSYSGDYYKGSIILEYYLGSENMFYSSFQSALVFSKEDLLVKNSVFEIEIGLYLNHSDINYYNESILDSYDSQELLYWINEHYPGLEDFVQRRLLIDGLTETKISLKNVINNIDPGLLQPNYKFSSIDLYLPVYFTMGNVMFNAMVSANFPLASTQFYELESSFMFNAGISYAFCIKSQNASRKTN